MRCRIREALLPSSFLCQQTSTTTTTTTTRLEHKPLFPHRVFLSSCVSTIFAITPTHTYPREGVSKMVISSVDLSVFSSERAYPLIYIESPSSSLPLHSQEGLKENIHVNIKTNLVPITCWLAVG